MTIRLAGLSAAALSHIGAHTAAEGNQFFGVGSHLGGDANDHFEVGAHAGQIAGLR